jgi:nucleotide-binding universal stress UspA family protein
MPGIVVGVDGSARSRPALEWAVNEASVRHVPLTVLTVNQAVSGHWTRSAAYPRDLQRTKQAREVARVEADSVLKQVGNGSWLPPVTVRAVTGLPAEELLSAAADADMIVVGSHGASGLKELLTGSVSAEVTHHAHCPVVVIPPNNTRTA